jgi:sporulation protein YqfC
MKMPDKWPPLRLSELFDLSGGRNAAVLTLTGARRLHIENHRGILLYDDACIAVNCGEKIVNVRGDGLALRAMNAEELLLSGDFTAIELR